MLLVPLIKFLVVGVLPRVVTIFNPNPNPVVIHVDSGDRRIEFIMEFEVTVTRSGFQKCTISFNNGRPVVVWEDEGPKVCKLCPPLSSENGEGLFLNMQLTYLQQLLNKLNDTQRICIRYMCLFWIFGVGCNVYHTTDTVRVSYTLGTGNTNIQGPGTFQTSDAKGIGTTLLEERREEITKRWWPVIQELNHLGCMNETDVEFWYDMSGVTTCVVKSRSSMPFIVELSLSDNSSMTVTDESTVDCQIVTVKAPGSHAQRCYVTSSLGWKGVVTPPSHYRTKRVPVNISSSKWTGIVNWKGNVNRSTASHLPNLPILILCVVFMRLVV
ncbi:m157 protein [Murid betaherpesvirus 1]|uniref:M157 n=1 Tax=Murid herpesvirus 1 TaxID=10366 RepID=Q6XK88_MUHV1|nr:m157 [Murid betaherpesvirus 1]AWV68765.1 m157 protein [Murid betaherpesvirus 1]